MVELACNIIQGCKELMGFIPDFFTTIGAMLLDEEIKLEKWDGRDSTKTGEEKIESVKNDDLNEKTENKQIK